MNQRELNVIIRLMRASFMEIDGRVFAILYPSEVPRLRGFAKRPDSRPRRHGENEWNHQHFDYHIGTGVEGRWRANYSLASAIAEVWQDRLNLTFPDRQFVLFVANELTEFLDEDDKRLGFRVIPTLRFWTVDPSTVDELYRIYCVALLHPSVAVDPLRSSVIPIADAFKLPNYEE